MARPKVYSGTGLALCTQGGRFMETQKFPKGLRKHKGAMYCHQAAVKLTGPKAIRRRGEVSNS